MKSFLGSAFLLCYSVLVVSSAHAHTPYLVPVSFEPAYEDWVSLDAGFAEEFFHPDVAFAHGNFQILTPAGQWQKPARYEEFKIRTLVEYQLTDKGTYRFTTGTRLGDVFRFFEVNGERQGTRDPKDVLPKGAKLLDHYQSVTLAETYVTKDKPTEIALKPYNKGLELVAVSHPNDLTEGDKFKVKVLFDGKPVANKDVSLFATQGGGEHQKAAAIIKTNTQGDAEFSLASHGVYLLHVRHNAPAPKGAEAPNYGYVYTLTFAVNPPI